MFFADVPGFGDNLVYSKETNTYWLAVILGMKSLRKLYIIAKVQPLYWLVNRLPDRYSPKGDPFGGVLELGLDGSVKRAFFDMDGSHVSGITSAIVRDGQLLLGSIVNDYLAIVDLSPAQDES